MDPDEARQRQLDELDLLAAMYTADGFTFVDGCHVQRECSLTLHGGDVGDGEQFVLACKIILPYSYLANDEMPRVLVHELRSTASWLGGSEQEGPAAAAVSSSQPQLSLAPPVTATNRDREDLATAVLAALEDECEVGTECLLQMIDFLRELGADLIQCLRREDGEKKLRLKGDSGGTGGRKHESALPPRLGRRLIYFHHILSPTKRSCIKAWASELRIAGYR